MSYINIIWQFCSFQLTYTGCIQTDKSAVGYQPLNWPIWFIGLNPQNISIGALWVSLKPHFQCKWVCSRNFVLPVFVRVHMCNIIMHIPPTVEGQKAKLPVAICILKQGEKNLNALVDIIHLVWKILLLGLNN